jgi:phosphoribosylanthranilate isomerase
VIDEMRTRIKICGLTRPVDVDAAVESGVDAVGFVFYPPSPRYVKPEQAAQLIRRLPPFVMAVGLFVNEDPTVVSRVAAIAGLQLLQFHGEEPASYCESFSLPHIKAARVKPGLDLVEFSGSYKFARAILLDAFVEGFGGGGEVFDWSLIPKEIAARAVLSGGLRAANVAAGIRALRVMGEPSPAPLGVDVSSGVETSKGIKDAGLIREFVAAVRAADDSNSTGIRT